VGRAINLTETSSPPRWVIATNLVAVHQTVLTRILERRIILLANGLNVPWVTVRPIHEDLLRAKRLIALRHTTAVTVRWRMCLKYHQFVPALYALCIVGGGQ